MPSLARKILIVAAIDGLILTPLHNTQGSKPAGPPPGAVRIDYKSKQIVPYTATAGSGDDDKDETGGPGSLEAHGIAGLLNISPTSAFLIAITSREQVALIRQCPVYVITDIALIPLSSQRSASEALENARPTPTHRGPDGADSGTDDEAIAYEEQSDSPRSSEDAPRLQGPSIGEDVIGRKGVYGRFAEKWFSKRGWAVDHRRAEGMSADEGGDITTMVTSTPEEVVDIRKPEDRPAPNVGSESLSGVPTLGGDGAVEVTEEMVTEDTTHNLTPKLLNTTRLLLGSRSFFFSYDWDITRTWSTRCHSAGTSLPLYKLVDPLYFWNNNLQKPFIESQHDHLVLPLMQGFVGQLPFSATLTPTPPKPNVDPGVDAPNDTAPATFSEILSSSQDFTLTLISRRSTRRAGLRYLRRGVDDAGNVANSVETEQLVATPNWDRVFSFVQIRGSIPLFFQQSPYALKPKPILLRTEPANAQAFKLHFKQATQRYGKVHAVSLVEKHGNEAIVGDKYQAAIRAMHDEEGYGVPGPGVGFNWFDFHHECRGMRFENVHLLLDELGPVLDDFGYTEEHTDIAGKAVREKTQSGVLRTNCMDCLDRTNVVQSATASAALDAQLSSLGVAHGADKDAWFNRLWADNGDAVSKQYASTAALKGDFTRTRKRNYRGALKDLGLTLHRYFTNIVSDFFTQAAIDFLLGSVTAKVFDEFEEALMSGDPAISMSRLRQNAVEISSKMVVEDEDEVVRGGWTMLAPAEPGKLRSMPFREVVVLLTDRAVYRVGFEWTLEKVSEFERVELRDVVQLQWGSYIVSTLAHSSTDETRNVGVIVKYRPSSAGADIVRVNTRSLKSVFSKLQPEPAQTRFMAFKVLPGTEGGSEVELAHQVCIEIETARKVQFERERAPIEGGETAQPEVVEPFVVNRDVIGLAEAKRSTGLLEQVGYSLRKSVWA